MKRSAAYTLKFWLLLPFWLLMLGAVWLWERFFPAASTLRSNRFPLPRRAFR